jgi:hypothetical protein
MRRLSVFLFCALVAAVWSAAAAAASGDFNGDGFADLAVGAPYEDVGTVADAGAVNVLYGNAAGLSAAGNQLWHQNVGGVEDSAEPADRFGSALAAGDFNGDGFADLAIGVPFEDVGTVADAGAVNVLYGSPVGLTAAGNELWNQDASGIGNAAEANDRFGLALAAGNFGKSARTDLAVGVPDENVGGRANAGAVNVLYGRAGGLSGKGDQVWHQNRRGIGDAAQANDRFGSALGAGDFGQSGSADLAVGAPLEGVGTVAEAGAVNVIYGSSTGLLPANDQFWHKDSPGVGGHAQPRDHFGWALAAADLGKTARADLAVGIPLAGNDAGAVSVLYGTSTGLSATGS